MFRVLSAAIIRSTITADDGHWYNMLHWIVNFVVTSTVRVLENRAVAHITMVELKLNHSDVTNRPILDNSYSGL
jgi:hypothetical protein